MDRVDASVQECLGGAKLAPQSGLIHNFKYFYTLATCQLARLAIEPSKVY